jgi:membrane protein insertase Oxa1/YidC/SpoIIIJ
MGWYALGGIMCVMGVAVLVFMFTIVEFALPRCVFVLPLVAIALLIGGSWLLMSQQRSARATLQNSAVQLEEFRAA